MGVFYIIIAELKHSHFIAEYNLRIALAPKGILLATTEITKVIVVGSIEICVLADTINLVR